jgi:hypothetical protein
MAAATPEELAEIRRKQAAGICDIPGCEERGTSVLKRCPEHSGIFATTNPLPARRHAPLQMHNWKRYQ